MLLQPRLGTPELHRQGHQPGLGAVVEVALDPAQLVGLHVERAAPGAGELVDPLGQLVVVGPQGQDDRVEAKEHGEAEDRDPRPQLVAAGHRPRDE
jgi:hypothetical protein